MPGDYGTDFFVCVNPGTSHPDPEYHQAKQQRSSSLSLDGGEGGWQEWFSYLFEILSSLSPPCPHLPCTLSLSNVTYVGGGEK